MASQRRHRARVDGWIGVLAGGLVGLALSWAPVGEGLVHRSYDLLQVFTRGDDLQSVILIGVDPPADRALYAAILQRLTAAQARLVVFDILLLDSGEEGGDRALAGAIRENGRVLLAADYPVIKGARELEGGTFVPPLDRFRTNAMGLGLARVRAERDGVVRRHYAGTRDYPSLPWAAAAALQVPVTQNPAARLRSRDRWLDYPGPPGTLRTIRAQDVLQQPVDFFHGKIVFLGGAQGTPLVADGEDEAPVPLTRWTGHLSAGVEILAATFLNLGHNAWLERWHAATESLFIIFAAAVGGFVLPRLSRGRAIGTGLAAIVTIIALALAGYWGMKLWFAWMIPIGVIPVTWAVAALARSQPVALSEDHSTVRETAAPAPLVIPDHTLRCPIGQGGYGEVWLATNAIGIQHAVKIVWRARFSTADAFEREFRGVERFMPVSTEHPGFLNIRHVGRNDEAGYFFYIMEAADDIETGPEIDPNRYQPRTLAAELARRRPLPPAECLSLIRDLAGALDHLHRQQLVHRDIKPGNIIYVRGVAKLADIGLVTRVAVDDTVPRTLVGTEGYMVLDKIGTVEGDLYALGKVLYVALSGLGAAQFPELPDTRDERPDEQLFAELNELAWRACGVSPLNRFQTAAEMITALQTLAGK